MDIPEFCLIPPTSNKDDMELNLNFSQNFKNKNPIKFQELNIE